MCTIAKHSWTQCSRIWAQDVDLPLTRLPHTGFRIPPCSSLHGSSSGDIIRGWGVCAGRGGEECSGGRWVRGWLTDGGRVKKPVHTHLDTHQDLQQWSAYFATLQCFWWSKHTINTSNQWYIITVNNQIILFSTGSPTCIRDDAVRGLPVTM